MRNRSRFAVLLACIAIEFAAACSGDITAPSPSSLALHFDSLYSAAVGGGGSVSIPASIRGQVLTDIEIPSAFGASTRVVAVTTASGVEQWNGMEFVINPGGGEFEFNNILVAYRELDAHTVLVANYAQDGSIQSAALLLNDSVRVVATTPSGTSSITSLGGGCATPPTLANPNLTSYQIATCERAQFSSSVSADFPATTNSDTALTHLEFDATTFNGEGFTSGFGDTPTRRVP
jgi:hypothetical protein